jgi:hypothetical protein
VLIRTPGFADEAAYLHPMISNAVPVHPFDFERPARQAMAAACAWFARYGHDTGLAVEDLAALQSAQTALEGNESRELTTSEVSELAAAIVAYCTAYRKPLSEHPHSELAEQLNRSRGVPPRKVDHAHAYLLIAFEERISEVALARMQSERA